MGFSSVIGFTVIIIGILIAGAYIYTTTESQFNQLYNSLDYFYNHINSKIHEKVVITNVVSTATQTNITIYNNGSTVLDLYKFTILFDGDIVPWSNISVSQHYLAPLSSAKFVINWSQPKRICIISNTGNKYYYG